MKKKVAILLAMLLAISTFALTACGEKDSPASPANDGGSTETEASASDDSSTETEAPASDDSSAEQEEPTILGEEYAFGDNTVFVPEDWTFSDEEWIDGEDGEDGEGSVSITYNEETFIEISSMSHGYDSFDDLYAYYNEDAAEDEQDIKGKFGKNAYLVSESYGPIAKDTLDWLAKMFVSKGKNFTIQFYNNCPEEDEDKLFEDIKVIFASVK
jgi:hypothetical protein